MESGRRDNGKTDRSDEGESEDDRKLEGFGLLDDQSVRGNV